jgi:hypothetical protein
MWCIGYGFCPPDRKEEWGAKAIDQQSDFFQAYVQVAKELGMNIDSPVKTLRCGTKGKFAR